jgi:2-phosphoglycerate kinase
MPDQSTSKRLLLIGGSSHSGKSTLAGAVAERLGWRHRSTDKLAKHPGRPWAPSGSHVPEHVAAHYRALQPEQLLRDVLRHYRKNVWPQVEQIVTECLACGEPGMVLEGSAVLPELAVRLPQDGTACLWLTLDDGLFAERIYAASGYQRQPNDGRLLVDRFLARTRLFDQHVIAAAERAGFPVVRIVSATSRRTLVDRCLAALHGHNESREPDTSSSSR